MEMPAHPSSIVKFCATSLPSPINKLEVLCFSLIIKTENCLSSLGV